MAERDPRIEALAPLIGEWTLEARFEDPPPSVEEGSAPEGSAWTTFEWMPGERFVVQRWEVPVPEAPDGLAVLGIHEDRDGLVQHYFDSRGVHRVYDLTLEDSVLTLQRDHPGFDQRFEGRFSDDGNTIEGAWEIREGDDWRKDFDLIYTRAK